MAYIPRSSPMLDDHWESVEHSMASSTDWESINYAGAPLPSHASPFTPLTAEAALNSPTLESMSYSSDLLSARRDPFIQSRHASLPQHTRDHSTYSSNNIYRVPPSQSASFTESEVPMLPTKHSRKDTSPWLIVAKPKRGRGNARHSDHRGSRMPYYSRHRGGIIGYQSCMNSTIEEQSRGDNADDDDICKDWEEVDWAGDQWVDWLEEPTVAINKEEIIEEPWSHWPEPSHTYLTNDLVEDQNPPRPNVHPLFAARYGDDPNWEGLVKHEY
ncbi:hypothetical protein F4677DRAFT_109789 [Hypoxylon crocopeplum]|nr:hypothetical protein F4677DRAFT_109789 [Hypoxylon crocopeplum]